MLYVLVIVLYYTSSGFQHLKAYLLWVKLQKDCSNPIPFTLFVECLVGMPSWSLWHKQSAPADRVPPSNGLLQQVIPGFLASARTRAELRSILLSAQYKENRPLSVQACVARGTFPANTATVFLCYPIYPSSGTPSPFDHCLRIRSCAISLDLRASALALAPFCSSSRPTLEVPPRRVLTCQSIGDPRPSPSFPLLIIRLHFFACSLLIFPPLFYFILVALRTNNACFRYFSASVRFLALRSNFHNCILYLHLILRN